MNDIGCTTPFGINLDNICSDQNKSMQALELFKNFVDGKLNIKGSVVTAVEFWVNHLKFNIEFYTPLNILRGFGDTMSHNLGQSCQKYVGPIFTS